MGVLKIIHDFCDSTYNFRFIYSNYMEKRSFTFGEEKNI